MSSYGLCLYRRTSGIYVLRLIVPAHLRERVGQREIHTSLGLRSRAAALATASLVRERWRQLFTEMDRMDALKALQGSPLLQGEGWLSLVTAAGLLGMSDRDLAMALAQRRAEFWCRAKDWPVWVVTRCDLARFVDFENGYHLWPSVEDRGEHQLLSGYVCLDDSQRLVGEIQDEGRSMAYLLTRTPLTGASVAFVQPNTVWVDYSTLHVCQHDVESLRIAWVQSMNAATVAMTVAKASSSAITATSPAPANVAAPAIAEDGPNWKRHQAMPVSKLIEHFIAAKSRPDTGESRAAWSEEEQLRSKQKLRCFPEFMGDPTLQDLQRMPEALAVVREYHDRLTTLPTGPALSRARKETRDGAAPVLAQWAAANDARLMKRETATDYVTSLSECFTWAMKLGYMHLNPAETQTGKGRSKTAQRTDQARETFSDEELARIFGAPWFVTGKAPMNGSGSRNKQYRPFYYWTPLLAIYVGGRANELAQLYLSDIRESPGGVPYLSFNVDQDDKLDADEGDSAADTTGKGDKSLKTVNSIRCMPLHPELVRLGFLDYVQALRDAGEARLFPELWFDKRKGYGIDVRKWFNERYLGMTLKIERNGKKTLHSLRHQFATAVDRSGAGDRIQSQLLGHKRGETLAQERYTKDMEAEELMPYVEKLAFSLPAIATFDVQDGLWALKCARAIKKGV